MASGETEPEPDDWTNGLCKKCKKFVMDGQGIQEMVKGEIYRFCWRCFKIRSAVERLEKGTVL